MNVFDHNQYAVEARLSELRAQAAALRLARQATPPRRTSLAHLLRHRLGTLLIGASTLLVGPTPTETLGPIPCVCEL